jgi:hypothetical protein
MPEKSQSMFEEGEDVVYDAPGPSERRSGRIGTPILDKAASSKRSKEPLPVTVPQKRKRKVEKEKEKDVVSVSAKSGPVNKVSLRCIRVPWRGVHVSVLTRKRQSSS